MAFHTEQGLEQQCQHRCRWSMRSWRPSARCPWRWCCKRVHQQEFRRSEWRKHRFLFWQELSYFFVLFSYQLSRALNTRSIIFSQIDEWKLTFSFVRVVVKKSVKIHVTTNDDSIKPKQHDGADRHHVVERYWKTFIWIVASMIQQEIGSWSRRFSIGFPSICGDVEQDCQVSQDDEQMKKAVWFYFKSCSIGWEFQK